MLNDYVREFFDSGRGEYAMCITDIGSYNFDLINSETSSKIKHLKIICTPNYSYPRELTIDKFYNLEILDTADFQTSYTKDIIKNIKFLNKLKILRLNNSAILRTDILPNNLEILIIDDICGEYNPIIFDDINGGNIDFAKIFTLYNVPIYTKQIILNLNYAFIDSIQKLQISEYFLRSFADYLNNLKVPFGCKIVLDGQFI